MGAALPEPGAPAGGPTEDSPARAVSYRQWGEDFFALAVNEERILGGVNTLAGQPIDFGPMGVGPGRIAKVRAFGRIGEAVAERLPGELISYAVRLPVDLTFELNLQVETHRFHADLVVPLTLTAQALAGLQIYIDVVPPRSSEVQVRLKAEGLRASITSRVAGVEGELRRFVARYVARELDKPHVRRARLVDVSGAIEHAWSSIAPRPLADAEGIAADLNEELEREIRDNEDTLLGPALPTPHPNEDDQSV